jgi:hypothetical protein
MGRLVVQSQPRQIVRETLSQKKKKRLVEWLKVSSVPPKKKERKKGAESGAGDSLLSS